jgi:hypothetical protein
LLRNLLMDGMIEDQLETVISRRQRHKSNECDEIGDDTTSSVDTIFTESVLAMMLYLGLGCTRRSMYHMDVASEELLLGLHDASVQRSKK